MVYELLCCYATPTILHICIKKADGICVNCRSHQLFQRFSYFYSGRTSFPKVILAYYFVCFNVKFHRLILKALHHFYIYFLDGFVFRYCNRSTALLSKSIMTASQFQSFGMIISIRCLSNMIVQFHGFKITPLISGTESAV